METTIQGLGCGVQGVGCAVGGTGVGLRVGSGNFGAEEG